MKNKNGKLEVFNYGNNASILFYLNNLYVNYPAHWHNAIEIIMPLENSYLVKSGSSQYKLFEGDILIIPPCELHTLIAPPTGLRIIFICEYYSTSIPFQLSILSKKLNTCELIKYQTSNESAKIRSTLNEIQKLYEQNDIFSEAEIFAKVIDILIIAAKRQMTRTNNYERNNYGEKFTSAIRYIEENFTKQLTLDEIATVAGYSRYYFSRVFKQYTDCGLHEYINRKRIRYAQTLLQNPAITITEVALQSGFIGLSTFNRFFKKVNHCTPSEFRDMCV